jgi:hypothetical protein
MFEQMFNTSDQIPVILLIVMNQEWLLPWKRSRCLNGYEFIQFRGMTSMPICFPVVPISWNTDANDFPVMPTNRVPTPMPNLLLTGNCERVTPCDIEEFEEISLHYHAKSAIYERSDSDDSDKRSNPFRGEFCERSAAASHLAAE